MTSESFCLGLALLWLLISFWLETAGALSPKLQPAQQIAWVGPALITACWIGVLAIVKIMVAVTALGLLLYWGVTRRWFRSPAFLFSTVLGGLLIFRVNRLLVLPGTTLFGFLDFYRNKLAGRLSLVQPIISPAWCGVLLLVTLIQFEIKTRKKFAKQARLGRLADLEIALVAFVGALLAGIFMAIPWGAVAYFFSIQQLLAAACVAARLPDVSLRFKGWIRDVNSGRLFPWPLPAIAGGLLCLSVATANILGAGFRFFIDEPQHLSEALNAAAHRGPRGDRQDPHRGLVQSLADLGRRSLNEKRRTAIYIPRTYAAFWAPWPGQLGEVSVPLLVPSLTGSALLFGMPRIEMEYYCYSPYRKPSLRIPPTEKQLCDAAATIPVRVILSPKPVQFGAKPEWETSLCSADGTKLESIGAP